LRQNLLTRNGRGAIPTEAGKLLLEHGRGILHQVALTREELNTSRGALAGKVSIGLPPSLSKLITVPLVRAFKQHLPQAQLTLTEGFSLLMHEGLRVGNLDMCVLYNPEQSSDLEMSTLHEDELVLISPAGAASDKRSKKKTEPVALADVATLPLILPSRPNAFRILVEGEMMSLGKRPNVIFEVDGLNAILSLVKEGMGHAVLPSYTLSNFESDSPFAVQPIHSPSIRSQLMMVWSSRRPTTQTQKRAMEILAEAVLEAIDR
jgi:LysR family nitrogen assimilation transcriptional regulator